MTTDPQQVRANIARTRAELGDSVEALAAKADVKTRARNTATAVHDRAMDAAHEVGETVRRRPAPLAGALAGIAAAVGAVVMIRRRRAAKARAHNRWWARAQSQLRRLKPMAKDLKQKRPW